MTPPVRARILAAAAACFDRHGYHETTMGQIAGEAGVATATLYRHFSGKAALAEALCRPELAAPAESPYRRQIMAVALDLFSRRGYQATTLSDIAEAAGVARTTVYAQFPGKEAILHAIMSENPVTDWVARLVERQSRDPAADLEELAHRIIVQERDPRRMALVRIIVSEGARYPGFQATYHQGEEKVFNLLAQYLAELVPGLPDPLFAARFFLGALLSFVRQDIVPGSTLPAYEPEETARRVVHAVLNGLL